MDITDTEVSPETEEIINKITDNVVLNSIVKDELKKLNSDINWLKLQIEDVKRCYYTNKKHLKKCKEEETQVLEKYVDDLFLRLRDYKEGLSKTRKKVRNLKYYHKKKYHNI